MKQEPYVFSPLGGYLVDAESQEIRGAYAYNLIKANLLGDKGERKRYASCRSSVP